MLDHLPARAMFRIELPIHYMAKTPLLDGDIRKWDDKYLVPPLCEIDELAMASTADTVVNSYCTVFAGTEVIERIKAGEPREDISMGLFRSIASRASASHCASPPADDPDPMTTWRHSSASPRLACCGVIRSCRAGGPWDELSCF